MYINLEIMLGGHSDNYWVEHDAEAKVLIV